MEMNRDLLDLLPDERAQLWNFTLQLLENHYQNSEKNRASPSLDFRKIKDNASIYDFSRAIPKTDAVRHVIESLRQYTVHTTHPSYFGLFNPRPVFPGILADVITAVFNPQMAAWSHAPFATEAENHVIREMAAKFGYHRPQADGTFCSGGAEANLTAVLCALNRYFPDYATTGIQSLKSHPVLYCSAEAHHSVVRAARVCGLGLQAVRHIPVDSSQRMIPDRLLAQLKEDLENGYYPFMVIANAGSTGTGAIDPLPEIAAICQHYDLWFHVDGAYGGAIIVDPDQQNLISGIEKSQSITLDIHKWFSAPMGTSLFLTSDSAILSQTFRITADYMPKEAHDMEVNDPFAHSIQWSRRFIGLRFYMILLMLGWDGLRDMVRHITAIGSYLKEKLKENGWHLANETALPIACFHDPDFSTDPLFHSKIHQKIIESGQAWISQYSVNGQPNLRACITNYASSRKEIDDLIVLLQQARNSLKK